MKCVIEFCHNDSSHMMENVSFHRFPKKRDRYREWIRNIRPFVRRSINPSIDNICSAHFMDAHFRIQREKYGRRVLRKWAVPLIFDNTSSEEISKPKESVLASKEENLLLSTLQHDETNDTNSSMDFSSPEHSRVNDNFSKPIGHIDMVDMERLSPDLDITVTLDEERDPLAVSNNQNIDPMRNSQPYERFKKAATAFLDAGGKVVRITPGSQEQLSKSLLPAKMPRFSIASSEPPPLALITSQSEQRLHLPRIVSVSGGVPQSPVVRPEVPRSNILQSGVIHISPPKAVVSQTKSTNEALTLGSVGTPMIQNPGKILVSLSEAITAQSTEPDAFDYDSTIVGSTVIKRIDQIPIAKPLFCEKPLVASLASQKSLPDPTLLAAPNVVTLAPTTGTQIKAHVLSKVPLLLNNSQPANKISSPVGNPSPASSLHIDSAASHINSAASLSSHGQSQLNTSQTVRNAKHGMESECNTVSTGPLPLVAGKASFHPVDSSILSMLPIRPSNIAGCKAFVCEEIELPTGAKMTFVHVPEQDPALKSTVAKTFQETGTNTDLDENLLKLNKLQRKLEAKNKLIKLLRQKVSRYQTRNENLKEMVKKPTVELIEIGEMNFDNMIEESYLK